MPDSTPLPAKPWLDPALLAIPRLLHWERVRGDEIYLTQPRDGGVDDYTWRDAVGQARRVAHWMRRQAWFSPGVRVAILGKNSAHWLMADFACWLAGAISVPVYPNSSAAYIRSVLDHSGASMVFLGKMDRWEQLDSSLAEALPVVCLPHAPAQPGKSWDSIVSETPPLGDEAIARPGPEDTATLVYTSGTTGKPKGVMLPFRAIAFSPQGSFDRFGLSEQDRLLSYLPLAHVAERWVVEANSLRAGFRVFFVERLDTFAADLRRAEPTVFIGVPRIWVKFQQGIFEKIPRKALDWVFALPVVGKIARKAILKKLGLHTCRMAGCGAAPLPPDIIAWYRGLGLDLLEGYGMSENFGASHACKPGLMKVGYVGYPFTGVEARLSPEGEVQMRSDGLMTGYYQNPTETAAAFTPDGWLKTGDKGQMDPDGNLKIVGRVKEEFKSSKGKYIAPAPIENRLGAHEWLETVCVTGAGKAQPFALAALAPDAAARFDEAVFRLDAEKRLGEHLAAVNAGLEPHERLSFLALTRTAWTPENGLCTPTLKVRRLAVDERYGPMVPEWEEARQTIVWER